VGVVILLGAICGDIVGSIYENQNIKTKEFETFSMESRFTDDSVMTVATMDALLNNKRYADTYREWFKKYPSAGYGSSFKRWCSSYDAKPYGSYGNGSAMRVSPVGLWCNSLEETLKGAKESAEVTHNHIEGIKGAQATAAAIYLAKIGSDKQSIKIYRKPIWLCPERKH
jgi:ADP-ribosylglycohydrolase